MKVLYTAAARALGGGEGTDAGALGGVTLRAIDARYVLSVELEGRLELEGDRVSPDETRVLMQAAHEVRRSSKATRGNIDVKLSAH
jgi:organic hydroperoxide reductase OsmC/OhrA